MEHRTINPNREDATPTNREGNVRKAKRLGLKRGLRVHNAVGQMENATELCAYRPLLHFTEGRGPEVRPNVFPVWATPKQVKQRLRLPLAEGAHR